MTRTCRPLLGMRTPCSIGGAEVSRGEKVWLFRVCSRHGDAGPFIHISSKQESALDFGMKLDGEMGQTR